jgi:lipoyl(octanoyl) transferase
MKLKKLGLIEYESAFKAMKEKVDKGLTENEIWILEHPPVFTVGVNKKNLLLPDSSSIPLFFSDRGGKITYHGPGQIIIYTLIKLVDYKINISHFVRLLENSIINFLQDFKIESHIVSDAPGVYVNNMKLASVGLRIRKNQIYHGISINHDMDLNPFKMIDPCGYHNLEMVQLRELGINLNSEEVADKIVSNILNDLKKYETTRH